jgi:small subunit ribosomal protein S13
MAQEQKPNAEKPKEGKPKASEAINIVRIAGRDINGKYTIVAALRHIKGVSHNLASAIAMLAERNFGIAESTTIGSLEEEKLAKLETILKDPAKFGVPNYMLNRRKDSDNGGDAHLVGTDLIVRIKQDMDASIKLQSWTGFRRQYGQKVRGQRTRSTGRTGETVGVTKKRIQEEAKKARAPGPAPAGAAKEAGAAPAAAAGPAPAQPAPAAPAQK